MTGSCELMEHLIPVMWSRAFGAGVWTISFLTSCAAADFARIFCLFSFFSPNQRFRVVLVLSLQVGFQGMSHRNYFGNSLAVDIDLQ